MDQILALRNKKNKRIGNFKDILWQQEMLCALRLPCLFLHDNTPLVEVLFRVGKIMITYVLTLGVAYDNGIWEEKCFFMSGDNPNHAMAKGLGVITWNHVHAWVISCELW